MFLQKKVKRNNFPDETSIKEDNIIIDIDNSNLSLKPLNNSNNFFKGINIKKSSIVEKMEKSEKNYGKCAFNNSDINYKIEKKDLDDFTPAILSSVNIETGEFVEGILEKTQKINDQIKEINEKLNESMIILKEQSRLDLLFIMDITNSMDIYLDEVKEKFFSIIDTIRKECAGVEIFLGFIGYRDFSDLDFGEKYINLELTDELENILKNIKDINAEGGGDIPEDLCGALEFGKTKQWKGRSRFAILVTDSPCHGRKYYDETAENYDNYPDGDKLNRNIEDYVKYFAENEISVFCLRINQSTDKMFKIFKDVYDQNKPKDSNNQFIVDSGENIYKVVTTNAIKTFQNRKLLVVEESEAEENLNNQNSSKYILNNYYYFKNKNIKNSRKIRPETVTNTKSIEEYNNKLSKSRKNKSSNNSKNLSLSLYKNKQNFFENYKNKLKPNLIIMIYRIVS